MYESITYDQLVKEMLSTAQSSTSTKLDKREGSMLFYGVAPAAVEFANLYTQLDWILDQSFADTASRPYLIRRAAERGVSPYEASAAVIRAEFTPSTLEISTGARFSMGSVNYYVSEKESDGVYQLTCETAGTVGNSLTEKLLPINYIQGLETAKATELLIPGDDEEETEDFRKRFLESLTSQAYGGNIAQYKEWVKAIDGVGAVHVIPAINGGGTVGLVVLDSDMSPASAELRNKIWDVIDPGETGEGVGLAPIGHTVIFAGCSQVELPITGTLAIKSGYDSEVVKANVDKALKEYFSELLEKWEDSDGLKVRYASILVTIGNVAGVEDVTDLTVNGKTSNIDYTIYNIPALGTTTWTITEG